ncbi:MAG: hypothetical protein IJW00_07895 [Clostridia bacterium]|nr:hypothetical protein [Clostridia bacterium]
MKKLVFNISNKQIFGGCLLSSIAHAIMTNEYPDLAYEQSWDGDNYSKQFEQYRMTVSFRDDYCVGVIRNDDFQGVSGQTVDALLKESKFPTVAIDLLKAETLEYVLLDSKDGSVVPVVTSLFYCNMKELLILSDDGEALAADAASLALYIAPMEQQVGYWKDYYEMSEEHIVLLLDLFRIKSEKFYTTVRLTDVQRKMLPGEGIDEECIVSFAEMNIVV